MKKILTLSLLTFSSISYADSPRQFRCITKSIEQDGHIIDLQFKTERGITSIIFSNFNPETYKVGQNDLLNRKNLKADFHCKFAPSEIECKGVKENEHFKLTAHMANRARVHYHLMGHGGLVVLDSSEKPEDCKILGEENLAPKSQAN